ncbi:hypothetical protein F1559_001729 [Cyanidiococcus yangmingshanensis]|uniref:Phosphatidylethanolamine N-methyltransferase n=1 Tax=Cyanidiococcus yangmingshanensis TaxID=2690220 RepID=A0A7J7IL18_9RHOD|nr:hypothetical protein F1559_001729 [Cyanidiococcus yangmingshanensis]
MDSVGERVLALQQRGATWLYTYAVAFGGWTTLIRTPLESLAQVLSRTSPFLDLPSARAVVYIIAAPILWNSLARLEYYTAMGRRLCGGRRRLACFLLACWIFSFSLYRDLVVMEAMRTSAAPWPPFPQGLLPSFVWRVCSPSTTAKVVELGAWTALLLGLVLVVTSFFQLGLYGTYLGDYFGILKPSRVTAFPFSHFEHPMYDGSSLLFLAKALFERSTIGLVLTACLFVVYRVATIWEGAFTNRIYAQGGRRQRRFHDARKHAD